MSDLIDRQTAIDLIKEYQEICEIGRDYVFDPIDVIKTVPSAQLERKCGKWIEPTRDGVLIYDKKAYAECSVCGNKEYLGFEKNYCSNCGADMRGKNESSTRN